MSKIAVYPGSFDPLTNGHVDIIKRGLAIADEVVVTVARNMSKSALLDVDTRIALVNEVFADNPRVRAETFDGLLIDHARSIGARLLLRGLRAVADFEYEYQMANMNRHLDDEIETVFLMATPDNFYVSSRLVKEVSTLGGNIRGLVPDPIWNRLEQIHHTKTR